MSVGGHLCTNRFGAAPFYGRSCRRPGSSQLLLVASGLILDVVAKARVEAKRLAYFRLPAVGTVED